MLAPVLDPLDRPAQEHRRRGDGHLLGIERRLGAEAAARRRHRDAHLMLGQAQRLAQQRLGAVRHLAVDRDAQPVAVAPRDEAARLDRMAAALVEPETLRDAQRRAGEAALDIAVIDAVARHEIVGAIEPRLGRAGLEPVARVEHRGQTIEPRSRPGRRVLGEAPALRDDERHRLADIAKLVLGEREGIDMESGSRRSGIACGMRSPVEERPQIAHRSGPRERQRHGARAAAVSIGARAAHGAWVLRTNAAWSSPGSAMSSRSSRGSAERAQQTPAWRLVRGRVSSTAGALDLRLLRPDRRARRSRPRFARAAPRRSACRSARRRRPRASPCPAICRTRPGAGCPSRRAGRRRRYRECRASPRRPTAWCIWRGSSIIASAAGPSLRLPVGVGDGVVVVVARPCDRRRGTA